MDKLKNKIQDNIHKMDVDAPAPGTWKQIQQQLAQPGEKDSLKNHIAENKKELDTDMPDSNAWTHINKLITTKKQAQVLSLRRLIIYTSAAACIILIITLSVFRYSDTPAINTGNSEPKMVVQQDNKNSTNTTGIDSANQQLTAEPDMLPVSEKIIAATDNAKPAGAKPISKPKKIVLPPQLLQMEKDYDELIEGQLKYTRNLAIYGEPTSYFERFKNDFKILEEQEKTLRKTIAQNGLQENSIDELAMIYQQKLTVLKKLQNEINKTSNRNKNITDTIPVYINL